MNEEEAAAIDEGFREGHFACHGDYHNQIVIG